MRLIGQVQCTARRFGGRELANLHQRVKVGNGREVDSPGDGKRPVSRTQHQHTKHLASSWNPCVLGKINKARGIPWWPKQTVQDGAMDTT